MIKSSNLISAIFLSIFGFISPPAEAQSYPDRTVELVVGFQAGGALDGAARALARSLAEVSNQKFVVVNRGGANGMIGAQYVARAQPDGYTLMFGPSSILAQSQYAFIQPKFTAKNFHFICRVYENVLTLMVPENSPYHTLQELVADIKKNPGKLNYGHFGVNGMDHMLVTKMADELHLEMTGIPFQGEAGIYTELLAGRLDFSIGTVFGGQGKPIRILAVVSDQRVPSLPDVPTLKETGLPYMQPPQIGIFVSKDVPESVASKLETLCHDAVHGKYFQHFMAEGQMYIRYQNRRDFKNTAYAAINEQLSMAKLMNVVPQ